MKIVQNRSYKSELDIVLIVGFIIYMYTICSIYEYTVYIWRILFYLCKHYICTSKWLQVRQMWFSKILRKEKNPVHLYYLQEIECIEIAMKASLIGHLQRFNVCLYVLISQQLYLEQHDIFLAEV